MNEKGQSLALVSVVILVVVGIAAGAFYLGRTTQKPESQKSVITSQITSEPTVYNETANWKTYTNKEFGYSLSYPVDYRLEERSSVYLKKGSDSNLDNIIEIYTEGQWITNDKNMSSISFEDFAVEVLKIRCFADGANGSQYCDKAIKKSPITNKNNLRGYEIYLERIFERYEGGQTKKSSSIDGPFFVFDISKENNGLARGLFIINDYGQPDAENEKMLREIIDTLKF